MAEMTKRPWFSNHLLNNNFDLSYCIAFWGLGQMSKNLLLLLSMPVCPLVEGSGNGELVQWLNKLRNISLHLFIAHHVSGTILSIFIYVFIHSSIIPYGRLSYLSFKDRSVCHLPASHYSSVTGLELTLRSDSKAFIINTLHVPLYL